MARRFGFGDALDRFSVPPHEHVRLAKDFAPYRHPRLATMKLSSDPNTRRLSEMSREELRQKIISEAIELGLFPALPAPVGRENASEALRA